MENLSLKVTLAVLLPLIVLGILSVNEALALEPENVLVLYNAQDPDSAAIASYYVQQRPGVTAVALQGVPTAEEVDWSVYLNTIRPQVLSALDASPDASCLVTTKGLPLRIENPPMPGAMAWSTYSSLESELTRVASIDSRELMGNQAWFMGPPMGNPLAINPYFGREEEFDRASYQDMLLTSRLDGFSVVDVQASIDRAGRAFIGRPDVGFLLDDDPDAIGCAADRMEDLTQGILLEDAVPTLYDGTDAFIQDAAGPVIGYVGHGRHGGAPVGYLVDEETGLQANAACGAVFHTYESYNAYSFIEGGNRFGQGLVGEWIRRGGTAGVGHVEEPSADTLCITDENILFEHLLDGYSWAESAWSATFQLSYVNTVIGDPLMTWQPILAGDTNGDGYVDSLDLGTLAAHWAAEGVGWEQGDFTGDSRVSISDLGVLAYSFGMSVQGDGPAVPEPVSISLLLAIVPALVGRRGTRLSR